MKAGWPCGCFTLAGIPVLLKSDLPAEAYSFAPTLERFRAESVSADASDAASHDAVVIHHHFSIPEIPAQRLGREVYRRSPWVVYKTEDGWAYLGVFPPGGPSGVHTLALFDQSHTRGDIYVRSDEIVRAGRTHALTLFPTDQILFARVLAGHHAAYFHGAGMILNGKGVIFLGHSGAGKSTTAAMLRNEGKILCDDRVIVRRWPEGFRVHGTWSHGEIAEVSPDSAPLSAILLLEKAGANRLSPALTPQEIARTLPQFVVRPLVTADWWDRILALIGQIAREVPVYRLQLDKSGQVRQVLKQL